MANQTHELGCMVRNTAVSSQYYQLTCFLQANNESAMAESDKAAFDTVMWISFAMSGTVGTFLLYGIIHYERFGGDSQKRSLGNRLVSLAAQWTLISTAFNFASVFMVRFGVGNIDFRTFMFKLYMGSSIMPVSFININTLLRFLQVMIWKRVKEINEELAMRGIFGSTVLICAGITYCITFSMETTKGLTLFLKEPSEVPLHICLAKKGNLVPLLGSFLGIGLSFNASAVALMRSRRLGMDPAIIHDAGPATYNQNRRYNKALMSDAACPLILCMYTVGLVVITKQYPVGSVAIEWLKTVVIQPCINCIVTPLMYYLFHKSVRQYYVESIC